MLKPVFGDVANHLQVQVWGGVNWMDACLVDAQGWGSCGQQRMFCKEEDELFSVLQSCSLLKIVEVCEGHCINKGLQINGLIPFNLLVLAVFDQGVTHAAKDC